MGAGEQRRLLTAYTQRCRLDAGSPSPLPRSAGRTTERPHITASTTRSPEEIRTPVATLRGWCPSPLDDRAMLTYYVDGTGMSILLLSTDDSARVRIRVIVTCCAPMVTGRCLPDAK